MYRIGKIANTLSPRITTAWPNIPNGMLVELVQELEFQEKSIHEMLSLAVLWPQFFTCVASQHLILCDTASTPTPTPTTTTTTTPPRFLKFYLE